MMQQTKPESRPADQPEIAANGLGTVSQSSDSATTVQPAPVPESKWVPGVTAHQATGEVAYRVLKARWRAVEHWLPLAAEHSGQDVEYVHQLRIATRRAMEAWRVFSDLVPEATYQEIRAMLRSIRRAADDARNWDVLCGRFLGCGGMASDGVVARCRESAAERRRAVQPSLAAAHGQLRSADLGQRVRDLLEQLPAQRRGTAGRRFSGQAKRYLKPVLKKFFREAEADLTGDDALHELRIRTKKLRYTMEIVAPAFEPAFRERLYAKITYLQDLMGNVNDRTTVKTLLGRWLAEAEEREVRAFLEGIVLAEDQAHRDLRQLFLTEWTPRLLSKVRRQFRMYCGYP